MAHYAFMNEENIVTDVIVGIDETELIEGLQPEIFYANFKGQMCKRTSYNNAIRGTFAGRGYSYDETEDIFIAPKPFDSWIRVGSFWTAPIDKPDDGADYFWNEENQSWDLINE